MSNSGDAESISMPLSVELTGIDWPIWAPAFFKLDHCLAT